MNYKYGLKDESFKHQQCFDEGLFDQKKMNLFCVRNSFAAFMVFIKSEEAFLLSMSDAPAFSVFPGRKVLRAAVTTNFTAEAQLQNISYIGDDDGRMLADCIENRDYVEVKAGEAAALWCEIPVPSETVPGTYDVKVGFFEHAGFESEKESGSLDVKLEISDVTLPDPADYSLRLDLWQHLSNIARKHDVHLFSNRHMQIVENYVKSLARLGQKAITVIASEIPWSGQRTFNDLDEPTDLYEYSLIRTYRDENGGFSYDYSVMDRYIDMCFKNGIEGIIEVFGLCGIWMTPEKGFGKAAADFPDGVRIRYLDKASNTYSYMDKAVHIRDFIRHLHNHFVDKGLIDKVRIIADEPDDEKRYGETVAAILEEGPRFRFSISINKAEFTTRFDNVMSDAIPSLQCLARDYGFIKENLIDNPEKSVSWYVCCRPHHPNTFIKSHLLESRFICILTGLLELDGFLRWNYTVWPGKPRERLVFRSPEWLSGDMNFVYPGNGGSPLLSLRYKALLRGIEDFELYKMALEVNPDIKDITNKLLMKGTSLAELSESGYDESQPEKPFSLEKDDYGEFRRIVCETIEKT